MIDRDVDLTVGEKVYKLKPTLEAMLKINRARGSLIEAVERARTLDFEAIISIIAAGAALTTKQVELLQQEVFEAGVTNMVGPVAEFLGVLLDPTGSSGEKTDAGKS